MRISSLRYARWAIVGASSFGAICSAATINQDPSTWAYNCTLRTHVDDDSAMNASGGGAAFVGQTVVLSPSTGDAATSQMWIVAPDASELGVWYFIAASSPSVTPPLSSALCITTQGSLGASTYLDYCQNSRLQAFRLGVFVTNQRYTYHVVPYLNNGVPNLAGQTGLMPTKYGSDAGTPVTVGNLVGSSWYGTPTSVPLPPGEAWSIQNCSDSDGNGIVFGSGWSVSGKSTGY